MTLLRELSSLWRARNLALTLTGRELATRHAGTAIGAFWLYAQPLLTVAAYFLVFDLVFAMRLGSKAPTDRVGAFLIVGSIPWMAFCDALSRGTSSLLDAGTLLQKNPLPVVLFPARAVLASGLVYGPLIFLMALAYSPLHGFSSSLLALVPLILMQLVLCFLLAYLLAILAAALRDTVQVVGFLLSIGIFASPVLFPMSMFPKDWQWVLWLNPATAFVSGYQNILLQASWPSSNTWIFSLTWIALSAALLHVMIKRCRDQLVDWL